MELSKIKVLVDKNAKEFKTTNQSIWDIYFFEQLLKRLAASKYKALFIFKGGFLFRD